MIHLENLLKKKKKPTKGERAKYSEEYSNGIEHNFSRNKLFIGFGKDPAGPCSTNKKKFWVKINFGNVKRMIFCLSHVRENHTSDKPSVQRQLGREGWRAVEP